jgi:hypothetical protein
MAESGRRLNEELNAAGAGNHQLVVLHAHPFQVPLADKQILSRDRHFADENA